MKRIALLLALAVAASGCDLAIRLSGTAAEPPRPVASAKVAPAPKPPAADASGGPPLLLEPRAFEPSAPQVFQLESGLTVWLLERPMLPLVSANVVIPYGASSDPKDRPGLAHALADMLDEGAGSRKALAFSDAVETLGADFFASAGLDATVLGVSALQQNFGEAFALLADATLRPRLEVGDFTRAKKLWIDALKKRGDDPSQVASLVARRVFFSDGAPYGHPESGTLAGAARVTLADVKLAHAERFRLDRATLVVVGRITRAEVTALAAQHLSEKKRPSAPPALAPASVVRDARPRVALVDRPKAVQTVIVAMRPGASASEASVQQLELINTALGGSFTSRLNQNLREEKGWTYGAGSRLAATRTPGWFWVRTEVQADKSGASVREVLSELGKLHKDGLSAAELSKVKALDQAELISTYESGASIASRFASLASLGLPAGFDASAARLRESATLEEVNRLARQTFDPASFTVLLVGDAAVVRAQLADEGISGVVLYDDDGEPKR